MDICQQFSLSNVLESENMDCFSSENICSYKVGWMQNSELSDARFEVSICPEIHISLLIVNCLFSDLYLGDSEWHCDNSMKCFANIFRPIQYTPALSLVFFLSAIVNAFANHTQTKGIYTDNRFKTRDHRNTNCSNAQCL